MLLANARLLQSQGVVRGWLRIEEGRIAEMGEGEVEPRGQRVIDLGGDFLGPGLIDEHVHGALGRDFMEASEEAFTEILAHHAAGGTTSLLPTSVSAPWPELMRFLDVVGDWQIHPRPQLPNVLGAHVEGPFLSPAKVGAQNAAHLRAPEGRLIGDLVERAGNVRIVTMAPELPEAPGAISQLVRAGIEVSLGHSDAWDEQVQPAFEAGATRATHLFNAMSSARRRGPHRIAGLLEAALARKHCEVEVIADGHHVSHTLLEMALRAKMPHDFLLVSDATAGCGLPEGAAFQLGGRDCVVRDGVGQLADGSALAGSTIRLIDGVRRLVWEHGLPLWAAWRLGTPAWNASSFGNPTWYEEPLRGGGLGEGSAADIVRLDKNLRVVSVWIRGELLPPGLEPRKSAVPDADY